MAHVVGVPKRDPCQKCQLPVFLAERLLIGKKVYHRTCLKCARCGSQLSPGSFYETEVDGEYCCETCPDEEVNNADEDLAVGGVQLRHSNEEQSTVSTCNNSLTTGLPKNARKSIADRLAFFEKAKKEVDDSANSSSGAASSSKSLLQKSVSDEEKSKSLQRMEAPTMSNYKLNSALSNFLNDAIDAEGEESLSNTVDSKSGTERQMETSDTENDDTETDASLEDVAPALPTTEPPIDVNENEGEEVEQKLTEKNSRFTATAELRLTTADTKENENIISLGSASVGRESNEKTNATQVGGITLAGKKKTELQFDLTTTTNAAESTSNHKDQQTDNKNNNSHQDMDNLASVPIGTTTTTTTKINLDLSEPNSNEDFTKDQIAIDTNIIDAASAQAPPQAQPQSTNAITVDQLRANLNFLDTESCTENMDTSMEKPVEMREKSLESPEDVATTERLSVVRARLQQFEVIANQRNNNTANEERNVAKDTSDDNDNTTTTNIIVNKLSDCDSEVTAVGYVCTNTVNDKKLLNTDHEETTKIQNQTSTPPTTPIRINETEATENVTKANLEDEAKLRAMEGEKAEQIEATADEINDFEKPNVNEVPLDMKTGKDNNQIIDVREPELKPFKETPKIEISEVQSEEDTLPKEKKTESEESKANVETTENATTTPSKINPQYYPEDLNPFKSDDDEDEDVTANKENRQKAQVTMRTPQPRSSNTSFAKSEDAKSQSLNPFDSSDDEVELEKSSRGSTAASTPSSVKVPPPRPPPPRISRNPFGEENDEGTAANFSRRSSLSSSLTKRTPVPTPRTNISQSQNPTPEPTPRLSTKTTQSISPYILQNSSDYYGSANSLGSSSYNTATPQSLQRNTDIRGSNNSLASSAGGTVRSRKTRRAPAPPTPLAKELFPVPTSTATPPPVPPTPTAINDRQTDSSKASTPTSSTVGTPKSNRKKRRAPAPPKPARLDPNLLASEQQSEPPQQQQQQPQHINGSSPKNSISYPLQSETSDSKLSDEEKALLEGNQLSANSLRLTSDIHEASSPTTNRRRSRRVIPLDASLLEDEDDQVADEDGDGNGGGNEGKCDDAKQKQQQLRYNEQDEVNVVYRRVIVPPTMETPTHETNPLLDSLHDRQLEKLKDNKEAQNRNRQSQISASSGAEDCDVTAGPYNKSAHGKWKRRKGPAPALPIPPRKVLQMLPLQEIRHELEIIEVQQQGLEKQGVILEKMIRDRCEGQNGELLGATATSAKNSDGKKPPTEGGTEQVQNSKEVEDLILQLFELVNEKNELFRRQAELMYLRRQHRLEQEQADLEYEIRVLMAQPERNKTDSDKAREESLIARLVEVVQLRNEVVECLEMDRLREAEEDLSIKQRLELHTAQREDDTDSKKITAKLSKKEKKKQKESKKLSKSKKIDADKDADETELNLDKQKLKKKKKKFLF